MLHHAITRDPCGACGVPGFKGCEHQLPFTPPGVIFRDGTRQARPVQGKNPSQVWS